MVSSYTRNPRNNMAKVSIIVPVHNTEKYLEKCVQSITAQTLKDIEIILVENGSSDNSLELCHKIAQTDERIKVVHIDKADLSTARNEGLKIATSDYVGFIDSDDTILPNMFEELLTLAIENNLGLVNSNFHRTYDNKPPKYPFSQDGKIRILSAKEITTLNFLGKIAINACTTLFRKDLFLNTQFPENVYFEDRASTFIFMSKCEKAAVINKSYYNYYQHSGSICRSQSYEKYRDFVLADSKRLDFINNSSFYTPEERSIVACQSANSLLRKLRHLIATAKSEKQKEETQKLCNNIKLIPKGVKLTLKTHLIRLYIKLFIL